MNKLKTLAASIVLAASAFAPAHAGISINGTQPNGISINGIQLNGFVLNGMKQNGLYLKGVRSSGLIDNAAGSTGIEAGRPVAVTLPVGATSRVR
ncbi:hypothetical protein DFR24_0340 [Panacagrimonas perspica]|uniref:Uncharacterized protein n=2 Tax=Panacagrimonas perspica TaxID=381431 RepID=A0A4R7PBE1_9GAMM|nr:hypothetical protein DFR24_0340 [Panacagrimonas perspica]THD01868.1 hypothetical protein B1810_17870 [Panacagrimonas perspica]